jgi:hypothetical protein
MFAPDVALSQAIDRVRKHPDYGDDIADQIEELVNNDDPDVQRQGYDFLSSLAGKFHPSEDFESDILDAAKIAIGYIAEYLNPEQLKALQGIANEAIQLQISPSDGVGVVVVDATGWAAGLDPDALYDMMLQVGNKTKDLSTVTGDVHDFDQSEIDPLEEVFIAIINLSDETYVREWIIEMIGLGEKLYGQPYVLHPPFAELEKLDKLIVTEISGDPVW